VLAGAAAAIDGGSVLAYWKLDETAPGNIADETGNYNLVADGGDWWTGSGRVGTAITPYTIDSTIPNAPKLNTTSSTLATALKGEWTFEAWIWVQDSTTSSQTWSLFAYGATTTGTLAKNVLGRVTLGQYSMLGTHWEYGTGTDVTKAITTSYIPNRDWHHVAVVKKTGSSNYDVLFYIDSVLVRTETNLATSAGGTDSTMTLSLGWHPQWSTYILPFFLDDARLYSKALSASEILADYNMGRYGSPSPAASVIPTSPADDANVISHWLLDETETTTATDTTGTNDLTSTSQLATAPGQIDFSRGFTAVTNRRLQKSLDSTLRSQWQGEWTIEAWIYIYDYLASTAWQPIFGASGSTTSETQANNYQGELRIGSWSHLAVFWEHGAGLNTHVQSNYTPPVLTWTHVAAVKKAEAGGTYEVFIYANGVEVGHAKGLVTADGGDATGAIMYMGIDPTSPTTVYFNGQIDDVRWSSVARTSTEIWNNYTSGRGGKYL
jgi:hypothetical protein